jgi:6-phosphogluconolactonase
VYNKLSNYLPQYEGFIDFYLGDERCVPETDTDSNYRMIIKTLFKNQISRINKFHKFYDSAFGIVDNLKRYENELPGCPNLLLLSIGNDGHIASLFPGHDYSNIKDWVVSAVSPLGQKRMTITPAYIDLAERVIVFAYGITKKDIVLKISNETKPVDIPARWADNGLFLTVK